MNHIPFSILCLENIRSDVEYLIDFLGKTPAFLTRIPNLLADLSSYQVVLCDPFSLSEADVQVIRQYVAAGGSCLGITQATSSEEHITDLFGAYPQAMGPSCEVRLLFTDRANPLGVRLPDAFFVSGSFLPLKVQAEDVEVILYADWQYSHQPMLTYRHFGNGQVALTTLQDLSQPGIVRILYRLMRKLAGLTESRRAFQVALLGYPPWLGELHTVATLEDNSGLQLRTICDLNPERLEAARHRFAQHNLRYTQNSKDLKDDADLDLVIISTPPNLHARLAIEMLENGKHTVVEKPLALNRAETNTMLEMADRQGLLICCHQNRRWDEDYLAIKQALAQELIGELFYVETFVGGYAHPCGFWHSEKDISGGTTFDWGAHYLDWILDLMPGTISEIRCTRQNRIWHDITNADQERILLRYTNGYEAEFTHSDLAFIPKPKWYLLGTTGSIVGHWRTVTVYDLDPLHYCQRHDIPAAELGANLTLRRIQGRGQIIDQTLSRQTRSGFPFHYNLADHLIFGEPLAVPVEHSARVVAVLESARNSADHDSRLERVQI